MFKASFLIFLSSFVFAQTELVVPEITVTGAQRSSSVPAAAELSGARLERKKQATLGETLGREAGVASSQFGQSASRPILRGQEGDRAKILQNGTGVLDASSASQDHAVAVEPLSIDKVEIVRGPGALIYGNNAVGGVVNMTTNRIPEKRVSEFSGKLDSRFSTVDLGRSLGLSADMGLGSSWSVHADGSQRGADDYKANGRKRIENSSNRTGSGAAGVSYVRDHGFVGTSFSDYESTYGTVVDKFTHINLLQQRWDLAGEIRDLGFFHSLRAKNSYSHYRHDEIEQGGQLGTSFKNEGDQLRFEGRHRSLAGFQGILGAELSASHFAADGEEAFVPGTETLASSVFLFEEARETFLKPSFALRVDSTRVSPHEDARFGSQPTGRFFGYNAATGATWQISSAHALTFGLAYTERAPNAEELYANGPHAATAQFEVGDAKLNVEGSRSAELGWKFNGEDLRAGLSAFLQDYQSYVSLAPTGVIDPTSTFQIYRYSAVNARFLGAELDLRYKFANLIPGGVLELELKADGLRAYNRDNGENLPRITPVRETLGVNYKTDAFTVDVEAQRSEKQSLTAPFETATGAYTWFNLGFEAPVKTDLARFNVLVRVHNIFDVEAKNHVSVIKEAAPLPGRNFTIGLQASF